MICSIIISTIMGWISCGEIIKDKGRMSMMEEEGGRIDGKVQGKGDKGM